MDGVKLENFQSDTVLYDAVVRNLQIIGEAVRSLPEETRSLRRDIEWTRIVGLRNVIVHHYFGIDEEIIWDLATARCPELAKAAQEMLDAIPDS